MKFVIINGPNLNMLGVREPDKYGNETYEQVICKIRRHCEKKGDLVDRIQKAYYDRADGIVINPGAYTHTSIALLDALKSVSIPTAEVHISDLSVREDFRQISYIRQACCFTVAGFGTDGYIKAIDYLKNHILGDDVGGGK